MKKLVKSEDFVNKALALTIKNGGATLDPNTGELVTEGYAVGGIREFKFYNACVEQVEEITQAVRKIRKDHKSCMLGFWMDGSTLYVDAIKVCETQAQAEAIGNEFDEIAIYDLKNNREIVLEGDFNYIDFAEEREQEIQRLTDEAND